MLMKVKNIKSRMLVYLCDYSFKKCSEISVKRVRNGHNTYTITVIYSEEQMSIVVYLLSEN